MAIESADIVLVRNDVFDVARTVRLSRATMRNVRENLFFAFVYNALAIPIAAGLLYPFFGTVLSPMIAAAAMALSSISVVLNASRLRGFRLPAGPASDGPATIRRPERSKGMPAMPAPPTPAEQRIMSGGKQRVRDPVCGMDIDPERAAATSEYNGDTVYFCAPGCKTRFDQEPERYAGSLEGSR